MNKTIILKQFQRWLTMLLGSFLMYEVLWAMIERNFEQLSFDAEEVVWDFVQCAVFTSAMFGVNLFFQRFRGGRYTRSAIEIASMLAVCSFLIYFTDNILYIQDTDDDNFWRLIDIYIICAICVLISIIDIQYDYHKRFIALKRKQMQLRLQLLQQQLSPHFLFNSLSSLQGMIAVDPLKAEEYVLELSKIMRYITENIGKENVALTDAISFIRDYMQMLDVRFEGHFDFSIDTSDVPHDAYIVPVSLQIAVENAIKHNSHSAKRPLQISIKMGSKDIEVSNYKRLVALPDSLGVGLKNLDERYKLLIGRGLEVVETKEYYTVKIPLIYENIDSRRRDL